MHTIIAVKPVIELVQINTGAYWQTRPRLGRAHRVERRDPPDPGHPAVALAAPDAGRGAEVDEAEHHQPGPGRLRHDQGPTGLARWDYGYIGLSL